jgi:hypothetical protein
MVGLMLLFEISKRAYENFLRFAACGFPLLGLSLVVLVHRSWPQQVDVIGKLVQDVRLEGGVHQVFC